MGGPYDNLIWATPDLMIPGMQISISPAAPQMNGCFPNSLTPAPISVGLGAITGTVVNVTWTETVVNYVVTAASGDVVIQTADGSQLTIPGGLPTSASTLRMWTALAPYDTEIQSAFEKIENSYNMASILSGWGETFEIPWWLMLQAELQGAYLNTGSVQVTLTPAAAVTAGAQWSVNGGTSWQNSGTTVSGLTIGTQTVSFNAITGWVSPASQTVTITAGATTAVTGVYARQTGSVEVTLSPTAAVQAGAQWSVDGGATWHNSGALVSGVPLGTVTVSFNTIPGWTSPPSQTGSINVGPVTIATGDFAYVLQVAGTGDLTVTLLPAGAVTAGAKWSVDGGVTWQVSGATVSGLALGTQTVSFNTISGWTSPPSQIVTITQGGTATAIGTYVQQTGSLKITLLPSSAVSAGAQWNVDGGAWQNSGATVSGLGVGSHTVDYLPIASLCPAGDRVRRHPQ